jgi:AcrR family transcriptional regulator
MPAKGQRRKQQIIETAKDMFMTQGFQSSHIGQVCDKLNIARGTVYQYFGNKREILYAILEDVQEQVSDIFDADDLEDFVATNPTKEAMLAFITNRLTTGIKTLIAEPIVIRLIFKEIPGIDEEVVSKVEKFLDATSKIITTDMNELKNKGYFKKSTVPDVVVKLIMGGILLLVQECERTKKDPLAKETVNAFVDTFMHGVV